MIIDISDSAFKDILNDETLLPQMSSKSTLEFCEGMKELLEKYIADTTDKKPRNS